MVTPPPLPEGPIPINAVKSKSSKSSNNGKQHKSKINNNFSRARQQGKTGSNDKVPSPHNSNDNKHGNTHDDSDDGWEHYFDENSQRFFFHNKFTKKKQWVNPRVPKDDQSNKNLPTYEPPVLPFEQEIETEYTKALKSLKNDESFKSLTTFEKYKKAEELKRKYDKIEDSSTNNETLDSVELSQKVSEIPPLSKDLYFDDYGSRSLNARELNNTILTLNNEQNTRSKPLKVTKTQVKQFNDRKKQKRAEKLKSWLSKD